MRVAGEIAQSSRIDPVFIDERASGPDPFLIAAVQVPPGGLPLAQARGIEVFTINL
jgi:hypothetical protein